MRLLDHVTLNFKSSMLTAAVFLDIEKTFGTTWQSALLYELSESEFSTSLIKLVGSFLSDRKCKSLGRRLVFYAKKSSGRGSSRFRPCPNIIQSI
jgi:hypothetical protein